MPVVPGEQEGDDYTRWQSGGKPRVPSTQEGDYFDFLEQSEGKRLAKLNYTLENGQKLNPDTAARVIRLSTRKQIPMDMAERNLEALEAETQAEDYDPKEALLKSPVFAKWINESKYHAGAVKDDLSNLRDFEHLIGLPRDQWPKPPEMVEKQARAKAKRRAPLVMESQTAASEAQSEVPT